MKVIIGIWALLIYIYCFPIDIPDRLIIDTGAQHRKNLWIES